MYKSYIHNYISDDWTSKKYEIMKGLVGASVGGGPGARAPWAPLNPALGSLRRSL